ncbi:hypothetical protein [Methylotuvimicrobium alcaliphilum]|uniref:hypothetical protein n=1 Tax=Methylotuvimicrobium alcaliphilum TaxID=271065 RepID=UPI003B591799
MNTTKPKSKNSAIESIETETPLPAKKAPKKQAAAKSAEFAEPESNVKKAESEAKKPLKKKKAAKSKVIRDSFSFPEEDYQKISELKKTCLTAGVHVKKGEILRAGLHLLTKLDIDGLKQAVEQVEKVKTGRPNASES